MPGHFQFNCPIGVKSQPSNIRGWNHAQLFSRSTLVLRQVPWTNRSVLRASFAERRSGARIYRLATHAGNRHPHALGAQRSDVLGLVTLAAIGVVAGLAGAFSLTRVMAGLLFHVRPDDPTTYLAISFLLIVVAFLACYLPARRAAKLDPIIALSRT